MVYFWTVWPPSMCPDDWNQAGKEGMYSRAEYGLASGATSDRAQTPIP